MYSALCFTTRASTAAMLIIHPCISSSLWVKVIFATGNYKNIQTRDCGPVLFFDWHIPSISHYSVVEDSLYECILHEIDEFESGLSGVDHRIRNHPHSSIIIKHQEFDDQRGLFFKRSLPFGIKNLKQYLRMHTYGR